jgi:YidC/Oxa1 family membrane protein insertase
MERRALLAFVASMLLFFAWDALYLKPNRDRAKEERLIEMARQQEAMRADSIAAAQRPATRPGSPDTNAIHSEPQTQTEAPGDSPTLVPYGDEGDPTAAEAADAREIVVVSDLWQITLTTLGGEVTSARLFNYLTEGEPVELFPQNPGWTYERVLGAEIGGEGYSFPLRRINFEAYRDGVGEPLPNGTRINVDPTREQTTIVMRGRAPDGGTVERTYTFRYGVYVFDARVAFASSDFPGAHMVGWGTGPGMTSTEANVKDDQQNFKVSVLLGEELHRHKPGDFGGGKKESYSGTLNWTSVNTKYFTTALIPVEPVRGEVELAGNKESNRVTTRFRVPAKQRSGRMESDIRVYMGPLDFDTLKPLGVGIDKTIEMGWKFFRPVSAAVLWSMKVAHKAIPNYGWVIIIISVLTKVLFFRLTHKSFKSMKQMQELQPRLQAIKEKYKGDQQKISSETMRLYKESGVNPLGGCLPLVLQMPVFIALFNVLKFTIEVRGEPWIAWITDLSQPDVLATLPISLPLVGNALSLLPLLMGASMLAQSKLGGSPTGGTGASPMPAGFNTMLPIVFTFMFYNMPSGLVLYWIVNTVLSVAQQWYIHREPSGDGDAEGSGAVVLEDSADAPAAKQAKKPRPGRKPKKGLKSRER